MCSAYVRLACHYHNFWTSSARVRPIAFGPLDGHSSPIFVPDVGSVVPQDQPLIWGARRLRKNKFTIGLALLGFLTAACAQDIADEMCGTDRFCREGKVSVRAYKQTEKYREGEGAGQDFAKAVELYKVTAEYLEKAQTDKAVGMLFNACKTLFN